MGFFNSNLKKEDKKICLIQKKEENLNNETTNPTLYKNLKQ